MYANKQQKDNNKKCFLLQEDTDMRLSCVEDISEYISVIETINKLSFKVTIIKVLVMVFALQILFYNLTTDGLSLLCDPGTG